MNNFEIFIDIYDNLLEGKIYKGLESDPSKSPPAQQHFATVLDFH